ncbi:hypothetical protein [Pseudoxanthomonas suwonensis]
MHASPSASATRIPGRALVLAGIVLAAFNLRTAVTSVTPLLDVLGHEFGFGPALAGVLGMVPTAAFAAAGVGTPAWRTGWAWSAPRCCPWPWLPPGCCGAP